MTGSRSGFRQDVDTSKTGIARKSDYYNFIQIAWLAGPPVERTNFCSHKRARISARSHRTNAMAGLVPASDVFKLEPNRWLDDARAIAGTTVPTAGDGS
jgi:hypothetical protein